MNSMGQMRLNQIERGVGISLWRQIEKALEEAIGSRIFAPENRLPTEKELAEHFGVNRHTLRRAIGSLEERGLVRVEQGRGTFVQEEMLDYAVGKRTRFSEIVTRQTKSATRRSVVRIDEGPMPTAIARELGIRAGVKMIEFETVGEVDGRPLSLAAHFFQASRFPGIAEKFSEYGSLTRALSDYGIEDYSRETTRVLARMPTADEAMRLQQPRNRPVLITEGIDVDLNGVPIQFGVTRFASDRVQIVFQNEIRRG